MLIPDQIYGIEYLTDDGSRYKFWVLEAERGTHPKTSKQDRKSVERMKVMYEAGFRDMKAQLKLKAPLILKHALREEMHIKH